MEISLGIWYGLGSVIGFGVASGIAKTVSRGVGSARAAFGKGVVGTTMLALLGFVLPGESFGWQDFLLIFGLGLVGYIPLVSFYKSLHYGDVGIISPLINVSKALTILLGVIFLHEVLTMQSRGAIGLILLGSILLTVDLKSFQRGIDARAFLYAAIAIVGWGIIYFLFKLSSEATGPWIAALGVELGVTTAALIHICVRDPSQLLFKQIPSKTLWLLFGIGVLANLGGLSLNYGYAVAPVSIVTAVFAATPLLVTTYGALIYHERLQHIQRAGVICIVVGLLGLSGIFLI